MQARNYEYQSDFARKYYTAGRAEGKAEGEAEGEARGAVKGLLLALELKGFAIPERLREHIQACMDLQVLDTWYQRVRTASSLADIFPPELLA